jgi:hypothetical protein
MTDGEFLRLLVTFVTGASVAMVAGVANHVLSTKRLDAKSRRDDVAYWRDFSNKFFNITMNQAEMRTPLPFSTIEQPRALQDLEFRKLQTINKNIESILGETRRAPEPLTDHVRLFLHRMKRAADAIPYDIELAKIAIVQFRKALDEYVRKGKTRGVVLMRGESEHEYDRVAGLVQRSS